MKSLEKGSEKVRKICDAIRLETIEPALEEARNILASAKTDAAKIIEDAERRANELLQKAKEQISKEKHIFETALNQASKQALESLRQELETKFFRPQVTKVVTEAIDNVSVVEQLIGALVEGLKTNGFEADIAVLIPKHIKAKDLAELTSNAILKKFIQEKVQTGLFKGGIQIKVENENLTIDITEQSLAEFLAEYIRKDLRQIIFRTF